MNRRKIYRKIARKHHVSVQEVKSEIQKAIDAAWTASDKTQDIIEQQKEVSAKGEIPTVEEFLTYAEKLLKK